MKKKDFFKLLDSVCSQIDGKKLLDKSKIAKMPNADKNAIIGYLVRQRQAIVKDFINPETDQRWLSSMGYLYESSNVYFDFIHNSETKVGGAKTL